VTLPTRDFTLAGSTHRCSTFKLESHPDREKNMQKHIVYGLASALLLGGSIASFSASQELALDDPGSRPRPTPSNLAPAYRLRLTSAWPRWEGAPAGCADGGLETVEGILRRTGAEQYSGRFIRRTRLLFCGSHGSGTGTCELILEGSGKVEMTGAVMPDETSPSGSSARLAWVPTGDHNAVVAGPCEEGFKQAVQQMYLSVRHGAEVPLPAAGTGPIRQRLENYAYVAEIE
jgi:hypothetical protein